LKKVHDAIPMRPRFDYSFDPVFLYQSWTRFARLF